MPYSAPIDALAPFQQELVGCWQNRPFGPKGEGGDRHPLSYNIMPLPATDAPHGYILKNFTYTERLRFNNDDNLATLAIAATAPNRGGLVSQNCRALFYEQQVRFAEGPQGPGGKLAMDRKHGDVVHVENGAWLWMPRFVQQRGPYPKNINKTPVTEDLEQPVDTNICKQMSIPHGNSILALGTFDTVRGHPDKPKCMRTADAMISGSPEIPDGPTPYPQVLEKPRYPQQEAVEEVPPGSGHVLSTLRACEVYTTLKNSMSDFQNPHPELTRFPNHPLQQAVELIKPDRYMHWYVTTLPRPTGKGHVVNIPFEQRVSDVIGYSAEYWMLFKGRNKYLAYTQTIPMVLTIKAKRWQAATKYVFPHVTRNTVTYTGRVNKDGCCPPLRA